ncbi:hypothetical protein SLS62_002250 [Diatrype stigma]|uniref:Uncharacterized protein n=1 Tax=Diatrype stigma TaxID=117547 RepID=A0AAN9UUN2_9PEZI
MLPTSSASLLVLIASLLQTTSAIKEIGFGPCFGDTEIPGGSKYLALGEKSGSDTAVYFRCWGDAGDTDIDFGPIVTFYSGNNAGYFEYEPGDGSRYRHSFDKGVSNDNHDGDGWGAVVKIHID